MELHAPLPTTERTRRPQPTESQAEAEAAAFMNFMGEVKGA
jgi:hypothetical protein